MSFALSICSTNSSGVSYHVVESVSFNGKRIVMVKDGALDLIYRRVLSRNFTRTDHFHIKLSNCILYSTDMRGRGSQKNIFLALTLLEIPTSPDFTFICRFKCSQAWSAPTEVDGIPFLLTERLSPTSSFHVSGYVVQRSCIS